MEGAMRRVCATHPQVNTELVERLKDDDAVSSLFTQLGATYPQLLQPLVHERDLYLAWSLQVSGEDWLAVAHACQFPTGGPHTSTAVPGPALSLHIVKYAVPSARLDG